MGLKMNGWIIGKRNTTTKGVWLPDDVVTDTNNIAKRPIQIDPCDSTLGWITTDAATLSLNTSEKKEGGGAINLVKTATNLAWCSATRIIGKNLVGKSLGVWVYIKNSTVLGKISNININLFDDISTTKTYRTWWGRYLFTSGLSTGWQCLERPISDFSSGCGTPNYANSAVFAVGVDVVSNDTTLGTGDFIFDSIFYRRV